MTQAQLFALSAACAVCVLIALIWAKNKPNLWRKSMYLAMCGYAITGMLYWLNQYTVPDLHPHECFGGTTLFMLLGITLSYYFDLKAPIVIPDVIRDEMDNHTDAAVRIARYEAEQTAQQTLIRNRGLRAAGAGAGLILVASVIIHTFGLAENLNGQQESLSKTLFRLVSSVQSMSVKVDTLVAAGARRESRIAVLELVARRKARADSVNALRSLENQGKILNNQNRALRILKPKAVPQPVQPIKPKRSWWPLGYRAVLDSLPDYISKRYEP